ELLPARLSGADFVGQFLPILLPIGVMVVPFLDFGLAVLRRIGSGKSPFHADKAHLHHRLLSLGHSKRTAVLIMYTWTVVISVGLLLPLVLPMRTVGIFWVRGLVFAMLLTFDPLRRRPGRHRKDSDVPTASGPWRPAPSPPCRRRPGDAARHAARPRRRHRPRRHDPR